VTYTQAGNSTYGAAPSVSSSTAATNPIPTVTGLAPTHTPAGSAFTLTVTGANFISTSIVNVGGVSVNTSYVNSAQLAAAVPATAVSTGGTINVTVTNPTPGGGNSSPAVLTLDDFTLSGPSGSQSLESGVATPVTLTITPSTDGFANAIQLAVTGVPTGWTAQFASGSTVTPGSTAATVTLTVTAPSATTAVNHPATRSLRGLPSALGGLVGAMIAFLLPICRINRRMRGLLSGRVQCMLWLAALGTLGLSLSGCGGGFEIARQNQQGVTLTVTGTSGTLQHSTSLEFTVTSAQ
jgi:hypothetical protein